MAYHEWGDESFDWKSLDEAIDMIYNFCWKYGRFSGQAKEKYGCYDTETEILTKSGWKLFKDLTYDDEIASLHNGEYLRYERPIDIISYKYLGKMYRLKTRGVSLLVTPNHNLYLSKGSKYLGEQKEVTNGMKTKKIDYDFELCSPDKYLGKNKRFKKSCTWVGNDIMTYKLPKWEHKWYNTRYSLTGKTYEELNVPIVPWLKFLGWYISEGCCSSSDKKYEIGICFNNTDDGTEKRIIENILELLPFKYKVVGLDRSAGSFRIYQSQLCSWLKLNCGSNSHEKKIPDFIKELSPNLINIFLEELFKGDGHKGPTYHTYTSVSKKLIDDIQELTLKAGFCATFGRTRKGDYKTFPPYSKESNPRTYLCSDSYDLNWLKKSNYHNTSNKGMSKNSIEEFIEYNDYVYCVTVPESIIYVRRDGIPVWCGNSARFYCYFGLSLHHLVFPRHFVYKHPKFPNWLWKLDIYYISPILNKLFGWFWYRYQYWIYRKAYERAVKKFPHIKEEITCAADYPELLKGL